MPYTNQLPPEEFEKRTSRLANGCLLWTGPRMGRYGSWERR